MKKHLLAAAIGALISFSAAAAPILTAEETLSTGLKNTNGLVNPLTFAKFDSSLGELTSVHIRLTGYEETGYTATDLGGASNTFTFTNDVTVNLKTLGGISLATVLPTVTDIQTVAANDTYQSAGFPARALTNTVTSPDQVFLDAATLALFVGPGTIELNTSATSANSVVGTGDITSTILTRYEATASVVLSKFSNQSRFCLSYLHPVDGANDESRQADQSDRGTAC